MYKLSFLQLLLLTSFPVDRHAYLTSSNTNGGLTIDRVLTLRSWNGSSSRLSPAVRHSNVEDLLKSPAKDGGAPVLMTSIDGNSVPSVGLARLSAMILCYISEDVTIIFCQL